MPLPTKLPLHRIRERRKALGLSQDDLAEITGCLQTQISRYETNDAIPMSDALEAIARALSVSADWLLGIIDVPNPITNTNDLTENELMALNAMRAIAPNQQHHVLRILEEVSQISHKQ